MLTGDTSHFVHRLQNASLILLSLFCLPFNTFVLFLSFAIRLASSNYIETARKQARSKPDFRQRTILVTGVGMTKGLSLARIFYSAGHNVIGADFEPNSALACGRFSRAVAKFYALTTPTVAAGPSDYISRLLEVIQKEKIELWVSCSGVASAAEDGMAKEIIEARTSCKAIQFDVKTTQILHEKDTFIKQVSQFGLAIPETHHISSHDEVFTALSNSTGNNKRYILKPIGMDDLSRADMTLLPFDSDSSLSLTQTRAHVEKKNISNRNPWILQQYIKGSEYCTHALVIRGKVEAFTCCPSSELLMHYVAIPPEDELYQAMLKFTETFAAKSGDAFTGHLSFDFLIEDDPPANQTDIVLYPIECNPRAHTAVALFNSTPELASRYIKLLEQPSSGNGSVVQSTSMPAMPLVPNEPASYYWIGHDFVSLIVLPHLGLLIMSENCISEWLLGDLSFLQHLIFWKDGTYEWWDPLPAWWLYHGCLPIMFAGMIWRGQKWSRMNVSTCKIFAC